MALADPQSVTINGVATSLARVGQSLNEGVFKSSDGTVTLSVKHDNMKRYRHIAQLRQDSIVANPLVPDQNMAIATWAHIVIDAPKNGFSNTQIGYIANAIAAWATPANVAKLITGES